ncbi:MAG: helix-turn-helix domain-containing protein [Alphaproteobacteria bacterium]|nr:helix-turn-helix domain-containing protein [Alphaproteobacteria bacterium]MBU1561112.1 helix-turn-helix domain-containing protein [Alphaproteobacteria bacterium]MBU2301872.1 helix-turn-helix domain-containing protein [Alphaproteobacteria bacterium]MBU2368732.1 helix-turn-helix domain-containing protein [Alphaproteobacteria bacterium]
MTDADAENILAALGHSARFEIFQTLLASSRPAGALAGAGRAPSTVSHHLAILARAGLIVATRRAGRLPTPSGRTRCAALPTGWPRPQNVARPGCSTSWSIGSCAILLTTADQPEQASVDTRDMPIFAADFSVFLFKLYLVARAHPFITCLYCKL